LKAGLSVNAEEIIEGLRSSNAQAWEEFHQQFWLQILAVISRKFPDLVSPDAARDVASDTLLAVIKQVRTGTEINPAALHGYVMQIALRKGLHAVLKRRKNILEADLKLDERMDGLCDRPNPEQQLRLTRKAQRVRDAMAQLRESDREILQRFYYAGETKEQIMEAYAISEDQFRRYKSRALTRLMAHIYGQYSATNSETQTMYTRKELRELVGPSRH
jgi:RNA polymerase sigma factor (sigma-70 family)